MIAELEQREAAHSAAIPTTFDFKGMPLRAFSRDDSPWFIAQEPCSILGLGNASMAVNGHPASGNLGLDDDEKGIMTIDTRGGRQNVLCVSESGLYSLIFKSRKPEARAFKKWVTSVVLPSIRKTGGYAIPAAQESPPITHRDALKLALDYLDQLDAAKQTIAEIEPKAEYCDKVMNAKGLMLMREVANQIAEKGMGQNKLYTFLVETGVLYKKDGRYKAHRQHIEAGRCQEVESFWDHKSGEQRVSSVLYITTKGAEYIWRKLKEAGKITDGLRPLTAAAPSTASRGGQEQSPGLFGLL